MLCYALLYPVADSYFVSLNSIHPSPSVVKIFEICYTETETNGEKERDDKQRGSDSMTDEAIVTLFWERDENAVEYTKEAYESYLTAIAVNILGNREDAEEAVNDTYLAAWDAIPPHKPQCLATFLGKLTRRIAIDAFRRRHRQKRIASEYALSLDELSECLTADADTEAQYDAAELNAAVNAFLRTLSKDKRRAFIGRYYYLDPLKTVAAYCRMSEPKLKSLLYRLRCDLKAYLQKEGFPV